MLTCRARMLALAVVLVAAPNLWASFPTDNPVATFYSGSEGYPAWTDAINWSHVINMKTYKKGTTAYQKFERARDQLSETGGVLYYPAGTYDFTTMPPGRALALRRGVVIRGEAPSGRSLASSGTLKLATKFIFAFRARDGGRVPRDWNFIGLQFENEGKPYKTAPDYVGIAWVHLVGASVFFGPQLTWAKTWGTAGTEFSRKVKESWAERAPDGTHPFDALVGGGRTYRGAGKGRLVFGCVLDDALPVDDFRDPGYGPNGFSTQHYGARIAVYGERVLVANNLLPRSRKNFVYQQKTSKGTKRVLYDYGDTCGIDINKELLATARADGTCPGYYEEGVVVRDNFVFNHGHTGYNVAGNWVTISGNVNDRAFLRQGDAVYGQKGAWTLTLDGWEVAEAYSDTQSRAFDLAGRNLWIDGNRFTNTGSRPGKDPGGIVCRAQDGTSIYSWAITHNTHRRGIGSPGYMGSLDADCHGLLIGWNQTPGWVGISAKQEGIKLNDCAFVGNKCLRVVPDEKAAARLGVPVPLTGGSAADPTPPTDVKATGYKFDAVKITWAARSANAAGFRVERRIARGKWHVIAYRPPRLQGDPENPQSWVDFTAPAEKEVTYRVVAIDAADTDKGASAVTEPVILSR